MRQKAPHEWGTADSSSKCMSEHLRRMNVVPTMSWGTHYVRSGT